MSKKKGQNRLTEKNLENFLKMMERLPEEAKELVRQLAKNMEQDSNDPNDLNIRYYSYEGPEQYNQGSKRVPKWLKGMWDAYDYDSWLALCEETAEKGKELKDSVRSHDLRKYVCMLIDEFYCSQDPEPNPIRLIGPLWLIEHYRLNDSLDLVLELLRQDAWFYTAYIDYAPQCVSAILYQIGNDQPDLLKSMLYEQGLIPLIKPIVFNALVWIVLRKPKRRLATVGILTAYLNHCLKICKQGASARNIDNYAFSLAYAHISEVRPILKCIYNEVESLDEETFKEIENIYDDPTDQMEGQIFDSIDGYLRYHQNQADTWEDEYDEEDDDFDGDEESNRLPF